MDSARKSRIEWLNLIDSFSEEDYVNFDKFIRSPFYNNNPMLPALFEIVRKNRNSSGLLSYEQMHATLFPGQAFNSLRMRKLGHKLTSLIKQYFTVLNHSYYPLNRDLCLIRELNKRSLGNFALKEMNALDCSPSSSFFAPPLYADSMMILYEKYRYHMSNLEYEELSEVITSLNAGSNSFYALSKVVIFNMTALYSRITGKNLEQILTCDRLLEDIRLFISDTEVENPGIKLLMLLIEVQCQRSNEKAGQLIRYALAHLDEIYYGIIDFVINSLLLFLLLERDFAEALPADILTIEDLKKTGILQRHKIVSPLNYLVITLFTFQTGSIDSSGKIISDTSIYANSDNKEDIYNLSLAQISFYRKDFKEALKLLSTLNSKEIFLDLTIRIQKLLIYYEIGYTEQAKRDEDNLRHLISRRTEIAHEYSIGARRFLYYYSKLFSSAGQLANKREEIGRCLASEKYCLCKKWLAEKFSC